MAVSQDKKSRSMRGHRHAHWKNKVKPAALSVDSTSGETHQRHHVTADGYYRGKKVLDTAAPAADGVEE